MTTGFRKTYLLLESAVLAVVLCGCIAPRAVDPEVRVFDKVELADHILVTLGPRSILENVSGKITGKYRDIAVVDGLLFRDTAYPNGGWELSALIDSPQRRASVAEKLGVDYLVLIGPARIEEYSDEKGEFLGIVPSGVKGTETSVLTAVIMDLREGKPLSHIVVEASGTYAYGAYLIYMAGTDPMTESAVLRGLSEAIGAAVRKYRGTGRVRIALLAAESAGEPFRSGE